SRPDITFAVGVCARYQDESSYSGEENIEVC
ncbi:hypothetical protein A2U01_0103862, partial [Trifolium medium]|nr:hypothetical protein [Trifolium medium]